MILSVNSRTLLYNEFVKFIGKTLTERIRYLLITPFKIYENRKPLRELNGVLGYYLNSSMKHFTKRQFVNEYLFSLGFLTKKRLNILSFQYNFLTQAMTPHERLLMVENGMTCWEADVEKCKHRIMLRITQKYECEGCLSLVYLVGHQEIYILAFTICSGIDFCFHDRFVILVSRLQGVKGKHEDIVKASKELLDIFPASALMSALEGLCLSLGANKIVCVAARNQVSFLGQDLEKPRIQYDGFWKTFDQFAIDESGDYLISVPFVLKPLNLIRSKFRKRTLAKRTMKTTISTVTRCRCNWLFKSVCL